MNTHLLSNVVFEQQQHWQLIFSTAATNSYPRKSRKWFYGRQMGLSSALPFLFKKWWWKMSGGVNKTWCGKRYLLLLVGRYCCCCSYSKTRLTNNKKHNNCLVFCCFFRHCFPVLRRPQKIFFPFGFPYYFSCFPFSSLPNTKRCLMNKWNEMYCVFSVKRTQVTVNNIIYTYTAGIHWNSETSFDQ